jgi:hypothetical protein
MGDEELLDLTDTRADCVAVYAQSAGRFGPVAARFYKRFPEVFHPRIKIFEKLRKGETVGGLRLRPCESVAERGTLFPWVLDGRSRGAIRSRWRRQRLIQLNALLRRNVET